MLNYLSLVKVIRWGRRWYYEDWLNKKIENRTKELYMLLTWAFVGHRLDEIEEVEIDVEDQERYLNNAAKMKRLRRIRIHIGGNNNSKDMYDFAEAMIKAIQLHHGPDQLRECRLIPNPLVWDIETEHPDEADYIEGYLSNPDDDDDTLDETDLNRARRILSLLPPKKYLALPAPDGSTLSLNQPYDPYAATIKKMWSKGCRRGVPIWKAMMKAYPGHSQTQILQRFRSMISLSIYPKTAYSNEENLLAWAVCEAERRHQPGSSQLMPLVPLERLEVVYDDSSDFRAPQPRSGTPKWKILQDGLFGFSGTLTSLKVVYPQSVDGMVDQVLTIPRPLYKLKSMELYGLAVDRSVWEQVPNIEELWISFGDMPTTTSYLTPNDSQEGHDSTTTTVTIEQQPQSQMPEIWFHCPKLTKLSLWGRPSYLLDPDCLHHSPNLQALGLWRKGVIIHKYIANDGADAREVREVLRVLHPSRWTWDWSLPVLSSIVVEGDLREYRFSFTILRSCPTLRKLVLDHTNAGSYFNLHDKEVLDAPLDKNNHILPFTHSNLTMLWFRRYWDFEADELSSLLQVLPNLKDLWFESVPFDKGFGDRELVETTKTHPTLMCVRASMKRTTEPPSALGLSDINLEFSQEVGSIARATNGDNDNLTPNEQDTITYYFRAPNYDTIHQSQQ
ncbi:hypothetical protein BGW42_000274 [Actinomortierella wolfii]|nr:hypothetical protein BGW42_000274 [Actinomortierella wolfii]